MKKSHVIELLIFIVLMTILVFLGTSIFKHTFDIGTTYHVQFTDIDRIDIGSPVRILGVDIGHVTKIKQEFDIINVDFVIPNEKIKLPKGTKATIESFGIAGSRSIELSPPSVPVDGYTKEIITSDPIRLGHAFTIMKDFLRATMVSIGGLYEFAKSRTQGNVENMTQNALNTTNKVDDNIINVTNRIQKAGNTTQQNIEETTAGMTRLYNEASILNINSGINNSRYVINVAKRSLIKFDRDVKKYSPVIQECAYKTNQECQHFKNIDKKVQTINDISEKTYKTDVALQKVNNAITEENISKFQSTMQKLRVNTDKLKDKL